jgi:Fur family ferric uptake transcriptional regulator
MGWLSSRMAMGDLQALIRRARREGVRITQQRRTILQVLCEMDGHTSAEEIHHRAILYREHLDLSTVYRTLETLRQRRIVSRTDLGQRPARYEILSDNSHHHLVCQRCGKVTDLDEAYFVPMVQNIQEDLGFEPILDHMALFGLCEKCRQA